ncbi:MAG: S8 family peptidase [Brevundimonas sp.]
MRRALCALAAGAALTATAAQAQSLVEYDTQWNLHMIGVQAAYDRGYTGRGVVVGVVDSGVSAIHSDLQPNMAGIGLDAFTGVLSLIDEHGHGSHVAGIIAGARNGTGTQGVAYEARLASMRLLDANNAAAPSYWAIPFLYDDALDRGVRLFNNSWGCCEGEFGAPVDYILAWVVTPPELEVYRRAVALDSILVWATGNSAAWQPSVQAGLPWYFPELQPNWLAVTAVGSNGLIASYANLCGEAAAWCLAAPGGDDARPGEAPEDATIVSASHVPGQVAGLNGTSMAAPHVTGAVAIARQMFPDASGAALVRLTLATASDIGEPGIDPVYGWGLLNVGNLAITRDPVAGSLFANSQWAAAEAQRAVTGAVADRLGAGAGATGPVWTSVVGQRSGRDAGLASPGAEADTLGLVAGADVVRRPIDGGALVLGVAAGVSHTGLDERGGANRGEVQSAHLLAYGAVGGGHGFVEATAGLHRQKHQTRRPEVTGAAGTVLAGQGLEGVARFNGRGVSAQVRAGLRWRTGVAELRPRATLGMTRQSPDGFIERGADVFSQTAPAQDLSQYEGALGLEAVFTPVRWGETRLQASASVDYVRSWGDDDFALRTELLGSPILASAGDPGDAGLGIGGDLRLELAPNAVMTLGGRYAAFERAHRGGVSIGLQLDF